MNLYCCLPTSNCISSGANISAEEAREAMLQHVSEHCCYGKKAAEDMNMQDICPSNAFHVSFK